MPARRLLIGLLLLLTIPVPHAVCLAAAEPAAGPWRLTDALSLPDALSLSGHHRVRYETLEGSLTTLTSLLIISSMNCNYISLKAHLINK